LIFVIHFSHEFFPDSNIQRESGRKAQLGNIQAAKVVADIIRTSLGPKAMLKMLLDPMGGIVITNDGNSILREIDVSHPAAKSMIELSKTQDEEVGDGTTSVIVLAGEVLAVAEPLINKQIHPTIIIAGFNRALEDSLKYLESLSFQLNLNSKQEVLNLVRSSLGTKFLTRWNELMCQMAYESVSTVLSTNTNTGKREADIKRYVKIEKIPGGDLSETKLIKGVILNKDITHPKMRRRIENPKIILLDCSFEYKKGESQTNVELSKEDDFMKLMKLEEEYVERICMEVIKWKPDLVITEKGLSDLAQHYFVKHNITALRRLKKSDNNRVARAVGATIVSRTDEIQESDIGTNAALFEFRKIGDEYYSFIEGCENGKSATILLRGASKDVLNEAERNLLDALNVTRNVLLDPRVLPGGGAVEMSLSHHLHENAKKIGGIEQWAYAAIATALEIIPRTLAQNCGANTVRLLTELRAKHATGKENSSWGIDGEKGVLADIKQLGVWEPFIVKAQTIRTAIESACLLLRVDDILSGISKKGGGGGGAGGAGGDEE